MARWEPGAPERLQRAALDLFATRGFEQTTTAEIAQAVGLTERTFFRHFADKREVLFHGQEQFVETFLAGVRQAPPDTRALDLVAAALHSAAGFFPDERRALARARHDVIEHNPALQEREVHKMDDLGLAVADALRARGVDEPAATLAARSGMSVFGIAFRQWLRPGETRPLETIVDEVFAALRDLSTDPAAR